MSCFFCVYLIEIDFDTLGNKITKRVENLILTIFAGFIYLFVSLPT